MRTDMKTDMKTDILILHCLPQTFQIRAYIGSPSVLLSCRVKEESDNTKKKFRNMCGFYEVPIYFYEDKDTLGHAMGKKFRASLAVLDEGFAKSIRKHMETESNTIA